MQNDFKRQYYNLNLLKKFMKKSIIFLKLLTTNNKMKSKYILMILPAVYDNENEVATIELKVEKEKFDFLP